MKSDGGCKGSCATETTTDTLLESFVTPLQKEEHRTVVIEHDEIEEKVESSVQEGGEGEATDAKEIETNENEQTKEIITEDKTKDQFSREKDQTKFEESAAKKESEKCPDYVERDSEKATRNEDANVCTGICATESNMEITPSMIQQAFQYLSVIVEEKCQQSELRTLKSKEISKVLQYCLKYLECTGICGPTQNDALLQREVEIKDDDYGAKRKNQYRGK
ncbi:hypothetical protein C0J52_03315 [Blattella germanica]|nr:hypothetical protein C0J52_03315 [Blattella germanica]